MVLDFILAQCRPYYLLCFAWSEFSSKLVSPNILSMREPGTDPRRSSSFCQSGSKIIGPKTLHLRCDIKMTPR
jgi:hypothetical protein